MNNELPDNYYPEEIYIDLDLASQDTDCPYFAGDVKKNDQFGAKYVRADKAVPEGWKLVPIEPTDPSYYEKIGDAITGDLTLVGKLRLSLSGWAGYYAHKAMLSAAPQPPTGD